MGAYYGLGLGLGGAPVPIRGSHLAVGGLIDQFDGAAAAYSLRSLRSNTGNIVRVRRASDNDEKDFTASQIESGEMVNWVNSQVVPPLDIGVETEDGRIPVPEGGTSIGTPAAAYSLRNLSTTYTGNVVDVRRSSDGNTQGFTAEEVSDGTLEDWVTETANLDAINFDGSISVSGLSVTLSGDFTITGSFLTSLAATNQGLITGGNTSNRFALSAFNSLRLDIGGTGGIFTGLTPIALDTIYSFTLTRTGSTATLRLIANGLDESTSTTVGTGDFIITNLGQITAAQKLEGLLFDINLNDQAAYTGSESVTWTDYLGGNDGTVSGTPTETTTVQVQGDRGTVSKWYDQSGNTNHAVQTTPANQPTIVEGGSLVTGGLNFDGVNDFLTAGTGFSSSAKTVFSVNTPSVLTSNGLFAIGSSSSDRFFAQYTFNRYQTESQMGGGGNSAFIAATAQENLIYSAHTTDLFTGINGSALVTSADTLTGVTASAEFRIGQRYGVSFTDNFSGKVAEFIIYNSDQSDNRTAIEANIGETYGITGIPAYDNTVDGFVETWYDQSGNGNDATQSVAGNQPKIVDGGSLVREQGNPAFYVDGVNDNFELSSTITNVGDFYISLVSVIEETSGLQAILGANTNTDYLRANNALWQLYTNTGAGDTGNISWNASFDSRYLITFERLGSSVNAYLDGSASGTGTNSVNISVITKIFQRASNTTQLWKGNVQELIIYDSDQSADRTGIEANIADQYGITLS